MSAQPKQLTSMPHLSPRLAKATLSLAVLLLASGCQFTPEWNRRSKEFLFGKDAPEVPDRMMVIWTDTVLHQPQQPGVRGFGGRVYFFKGTGTTPIEVDGGLAVYAFDASGNSALSSKPERKFVFTADQFAEFLSHTDMGPSYSVWVPWDQVGGVSKQLSLVTRFEGRQGGVVISDPTVKLLPGLDPPSSTKPPLAHTPQPPAQQSLNIQQAATPAISGLGPLTPGATQAVYVTPAAPHQYVRPAASHSQALPNASGAPTAAAQSAASRDVLTIDLPPSFNRHLQGETGGQNPTDAGVSLTPQSGGSDSSPSSASGPVTAPETAPSRLRQQTDLGVRTSAAGTFYRLPGQRYPFRQQPQLPTSQNQQEKPVGDAAGPKPARTSPLRAGWLEELPATPRGYSSQSK